MNVKSLTPEQMRARKLKRAKIIQVHCPHCAASPGDRCYRSVSDGKRRKSPHIERVRIYYSTHSNTED